MLFSWMLSPEAEGSVGLAKIGESDIWGKRIYKGTQVGKSMKCSGNWRSPLASEWCGESLRVSSCQLGAGAWIPPCWGKPSLTAILPLRSLRMYLNPYRKPFRCLRVLLTQRGAWYWLQSQPEVKWCSLLTLLWDLEQKGQSSLPIHLEFTKSAFWRVI